MQNKQNYFLKLKRQFSLPVNICGKDFNWSKFNLWHFILIERNSRGGNLIELIEFKVFPIWRIVPTLPGVQSGGERNSSSQEHVALPQDQLPGTVYAIRNTWPCRKNRSMKPYKLSRTHGLAAGSDPWDRICYQEHMALLQDQIPGTV